MKQHCDRTRTQPTPEIDRAAYKPAATRCGPGLVDRRNAQLAERTDRGFIRPFDVSDCDISHHQRAPTFCEWPDPIVCRFFSGTVAFLKMKKTEKDQPPAP